MAISYSSPSPAPLKAGDPGGTNLPTAIVNANLLSNTARAADCFIQQKFSNKLQAFLVGYVNLTYSQYAIYK